MYINNEICTMLVNAGENLQSSMNNPEKPGNQVWTIQRNPAIKYEQSRETQQSSMNNPEKPGNQVWTIQRHPAIKYE
jgi:hypothetical protein